MNVKIAHLLSNPSDERERRSIASVSALEPMGFERVEMVNPRWSGDMPEHRPCNERWFPLTKAHYGCWKAHRDAITEHLVDVDALLICECDCIFVEQPEATAKRIEAALDACRNGDLTAFTFGFRHNGKTIDRIGSNVIVINQWIGTECYMVPIEARPIFVEMLANPWDAYDICLTHHLVDVDKRRIGTFSDRPVAVQANGKSLITDGMNTNEKHFTNLRYQ